MSYNIQDFIGSDHTRSPFYVLIGRKTDYSHSPLIHNTALKECKLEGSYYALNVTENELNLCDNLFKHPNFRGANITIPYKSDLLTRMNSLDEAARDIKAMNTVVTKNGTLHGHNTDVYGFQQPLEDHWTPKSTTDSVLVLGTGGAAKAVIYALNEMKVGQIVVVSRNPDQVHFHPKNISVVSYQDLYQSDFNSYSLIVNTTPVGMGHLEGSSPLNREWLKKIQPDIVYDLIYNPADTQFLKDAQEVGIKKRLNGLPMLVHQAAKAFELWTHNSFPMKKVKSILHNQLVQ